jgi:hypothetical protein
MSDDRLIEAFENDTLSPEQLSHQGHLQLAFTYLTRLPLLEASLAMRDGLKRFAARIGQSGLYHETVTLAFMSLVAERRVLSPTLTWPEFLAAYPELCDRGLLEHYYPDGELESELARGCFLLPGRRVPASAALQPAPARTSLDRSRRHAGSP